MFTMLVLLELIVLSPLIADAEPVGPRMGIGPSTTLVSENLTFSNFTSSFTAQGTFSPPSIGDVFVQPIGPQDFFSIFTFFPPPPGTTFEGGLHIVHASPRSFWIGILREIAGLLADRDHRLRRIGVGFVARL
jgi:hypothetical protein